MICGTRSDFKVGIRLEVLVSARDCSITFPGSSLETEPGAIQGNGVWGAGEGDGDAGDEKTGSNRGFHNGPRSMMSP